MVSRSFSSLSDGALMALLEEDVPFGDLTTEVLGVGALSGELTFVARARMQVCGTEEATRLFQLRGARARRVCASGASAAPGDELLRAYGPAAALLAVWKVAQNLVEWTSGIASATAELVHAAESAGRAVPVACTRKAFPGTRALASKAVRSGGATLHRLGLSESLLVFPEHRAFFAPPDLPHAVIERVRQRERERRLVVEVTSLEQALTFARAGAEALQLEHFSPAALAACRAELTASGLRPLLLAAGGVTAQNAAAYVAAGADVLVSSAPYQAPPANVKVAIAPRVSYEMQNGSLARR